MINEPIDPKRILSIYPTVNGASYSCFEGADHLVGWGNISRGTDNLRKKIQDLIDQFQPEIIVTEQEPINKAMRGKQTIKSLKLVQKLSETNQIYLKQYARLMVKGVFSCFDANNKYETAVYLAQVFPQLSSKLPPKPKIWESQHYRMGLFDSVAFAFAYYYVEGELNND